ncbi:MAG: hypothetical protein ACPGVN_01565 [Alphaproteobacteria bacterium]
MFNPSRRLRVLSTTAASTLAGTLVGVALISAVPAPAHGQGIVQGAKNAVSNVVGNVFSNSGDVRQERIVLNQEAEIQDAGTAVDSGTPFNIMVDGVPIFGDVNTAAAEDDQRTMDVALDAMDIHVQVDIEDLDRAANVEAIRRSVGENVGAVQFFTYWNYGAFIKDAEIRIFSANKSVDGTPREVVKVIPGKATTWQSTKAHGRDLTYVLRLYGEDGKFDETEPKLLKVDKSQRSTGDEVSVAKEALAAYGKNRLTTKNIDIHGGAVTVHGKMIPEGHRIFVMGIPVPVSDTGGFVIKEILPPGNHNVVIAALDPNDRGLEFQRNLSIPANNWFYVAMGDLTVGAGTSSGPTELTGFKEADKAEVDVVGRAAFFLRGKIQGKYLLTAMLDTTEDDLGNLAKKFTSKDPNGVLNRIDPDKHYPIYGDDATTEDLTAGQGNIFVKLERGESHVMWGSYKTQIVGADLAQIRRSLYGAQLRYNSQSQTSFGEKRYQVEGFAAQPDSLPQTDVFRGTGGSVYFLNRQDIQSAGEEVRIEVRDQTTGTVLQSRKLVANEDYDIDYIQGRIILFAPLAGTADDGFIVSNSNLDGHPQFLVARYEYTPALNDVDGMSFGGRAQAWVGDILRVGGTAHYEDVNSVKESLVEVDALVRLNAGTYIKGEFAQSNAVADYSTSSSDGGYDTIVTGNNTGTSTKANAYRLEAGVDLGEVGGLTGATANAYVQKREAGFSSEGQDTTDEVMDMGVQATIPVGDFVNIRGQFNVNDNQTTGISKQTAKADAEFNFGDRFNAGVGVGYTTDSTGEDRLDVGGKLGIKADDYEAYVFGQTTVSKGASRSRNSRIGVGGKAKITDRLSIGGEVSTGDGGLGGKASAEYQISDRTSTYLAYEVASRTNTGTGTGGGGTYADDLGTLTFGGRSRYTDALTVYGEERIKHGDRGVNALTHAYGIEYVPSDAWTFGANFEVGSVMDTAGNDVKRTAVSGTLGYKTDGFNIGGGLEARLDKDETAGTERTTYLARAKAGLTFNPNWRMQAKLNVVMSQANGNFKDGDFIEGSVGFAYRPTKNDNLNALFSYRGYYDLPSSQQVTSTGANANYKQRSHIVSADVIYQMTKNLSIGAKYGLKFGETTSSRNTDDWQASTVQLGVLRADWHVVRDWDATVEVRALHQSQIGSTRVGALATIYRHFGKNLKVGVGYNFSDISDDLTNLNAGSQGVFINAVTKF